jgi:oligosaccharide repeat unit polymerase
MILLSIFFNLASVFVAKIMGKTFINPIIVCFLGFLVSGFIYQFGTLVGSTHESSILSTRVKTMILIFSILMLFVAFLIRNRIPRIRLERNHLRWFHLVLSGSIFLIVISTILLFRKNGWVPAFVNMGRFYGLGNVSYADVLVPFFTPLSFGLFRGIFLLQIIKLIEIDEPLSIGLKRYWKSSLAVLSCAPLILMTGLRSPIFDIIIMSLMAYTSFYVIKGKHMLVIGGIFSSFVILFLLLGNQRMGIVGIQGNPFSDMMGFSSGINILDVGLGWLNAYAGTAYLNLNSIVEYYPYTNHGAGILREILPDFIFGAYLPDAPPPIEYIKTNGLMAFHGLTFRTAYADYFGEFGYVGAIIAGFTMLVICAIVYNYRLRNMRAFALYISLCPGIVFFSLFDRFTGLSNLVPVLFALLLVKR